MQNNNIIFFKNPFSNGRVFCLMAFLLLSLTIISQPHLKFKDTKKRFGFVKQGTIVKVEFLFTNKGNQDLMITDAKAECSCTTVNFPKYAIKPNQTDTLTVLFDTKSAYDRQDRIVEVLSNSKKTIQNIRFKGVVLQ